MNIDADVLGMTTEPVNEEREYSIFPVVHPMSGKGVFAYSNGMGEPVYYDRFFTKRGADWVVLLVGEDGETVDLEVVKDSREIEFLENAARTRSNRPVSIEKNANGVRTGRVKYLDRLMGSTPTYPKLGRQADWKHPNASGQTGAEVLAEVAEHMGTAAARVQRRNGSLVARFTRSRA